MPRVNGKEFPYTEKGMRAAKAYANKVGKKVTRAENTPEYNEVIYKKGGKVSYQVGSYIPPAATGPKGGKAGPILRQWARGIPQGIASTAINKTPLGTAINVVGTGVRAARGKLGTKGGVNVGKGITSVIGSRIRKRRAERKARKARKAKG